MLTSQYDNIVIIIHTHAHIYTHTYAHSHIHTHYKYSPCFRSLAHPSLGLLPTLVSNDQSLWP